METQKYRESLIDQAVTAFSRDKLDEAAFEAFVARVHNARGEVELREAAAEIAPLVPPAPPPEPTLAEARELVLHMGNSKRQGLWIDARTYRLEGKMSNFDLDYTAYAEAQDFSMTLMVDLSMSNLRLRVPADWQVDIRIARNSASNVVDRGPFPNRGSNRIVIEGALSMSTIKVKRSRGVHGGLFALLFGR